METILKQTNKQLIVYQQITSNTIQKRCISLSDKNYSLNIFLCNFNYLVGATHSLRATYQCRKIYSKQLASKSKN